jgi:hypothetical protein
MASSKLQTPVQHEVIQKLVQGFEDNNKLTQTLLEEIVDSESDFASIKTELSILRENVQSLSEIIREGNGAASIITKIALIEQRLSVIDKWIEKQEEKEKENTEFKSVIDVGLVTIKTHLDEIKKYLEEINERHDQEDKENQELVFEKKKTKIATAAEKHNSIMKIVTALIIAVVGIISGGSVASMCGQNAANSAKQKDKIVIVQPQPSASVSTNK